MPRFGFSQWAISPFSSQDGAPDVTPDDYSYITSADLENRGFAPRPYIVDPPQAYIHDPYSTSAPAPPPVFNRRHPEDDVLLIKHQNVTYPEHFPPFTIGDGKLLVGDIRERVQMILHLSDRQAKRIKLYYKGRRLKNDQAPACEYGVKNNSEILMAPGESRRESESDASEEVVAVNQNRADRYGAQPSSPRFDRTARWDDWSPRGSGSQVGLDVPTHSTRQRAASNVRTQSPGSSASVASAPSAPLVGVPGGPLEKLNIIATDFNSKLLPLCHEFIAQPPNDPKKRVDDHRRLSETVMQQTILKLDAVDTSSEEGARARRKELVVRVQDILNRMDTAKNRT
ncbi:BAG domain-containing protein [Chaetomium sp. MPI-SDFR-AT-0129]|nr:BAG domain-containing protein [Chaetomium sp. MPI-SDFR-AT-0129]